MKKRIAVLATIAAVIICLVIGCGVFFPSMTGEKGKGNGLSVEVRCGAPGAGSSRGLIDDAGVLAVSVEAKNSHGGVVGSGTLVKGKSYWARLIKVTESGLIGFHAVAKGEGDVALYSGWNTVTISEMSGIVTIAMTTLNGLVGEWLFSGNASDTSGGGHDGTVSGATLTADRFCVADRAYAFGGAAVINVQDVGVNTNAGAVNTVSFWIKKDAGFNDTIPFSWASTPYDLYFLSGRFGINTGSGDTLGISDSLSTGSWYHVVAEFYNGVPGGSNSKLFINGVEQSLSQSGSPSGRSVTTGIGIGAMPGFGTGYYFTGSIDDIRIYSRALTPAEVSDLCAEGGWHCSPGSPGSLDLFFGMGGKVTTAFGTGSDDEIHATALQPDGKIVVAGYSYTGPTNSDFALARYSTDGSLNTGFGGSGIVTTSIGVGYDKAYGIAIQPDGKIVVAGFSSNGVSNSFALARYNTGGSLDTSFGINGKVTTAIARSEAHAIAIQPDGKIVVAGCSDDGIGADIALARYNTNGSLDTSFDADGKVTTSIGSWSCADAITLQSDGKIVVAGYSDLGGGYDFALARYNTDGSLDTSFDADGKVTTAIGSGDDQAHAIAIQSDGKIVAAGWSYYGSKYHFALTRYNTNGSLDTSFDADGKVTTSIGSGHCQANALALQSDGKIVVAGYSGIGSNYDFALARYNTDGSLDTGFDTDGIVTIDFGSGIDYAYAIALQSDGKIVVAGFYDNGGKNVFALARYRP